MTYKDVNVTIMEGENFGHRVRFEKDGFVLTILVPLHILVQTRFTIDPIRHDVLRKMFDAAVSNLNEIIHIWKNDNKMLKEENDEN